MKNVRVELQDVEEWSFGNSDESTIYYNSQDRYENVKSIFSLDCGDAFCDFDLGTINLPALESIIIYELEKYTAEKLLNAISPQSFANVKEVCLYIPDEITVLPQWLSWCKNATHIDLAIKGVTDLPQEFGKMLELRDISVASCGFSKIPDSIFKCKNIETLSIDHSQSITEVPDAIGELENLKDFTICRTAFKYISPKLFLLPKLERLNFALTSFEDPNTGIYDALIELKKQKPGRGFQEQGMGGEWFNELWEQA